VNPRNLVIVALILVGVFSVAFILLPSGPDMPGMGDEYGDSYGGGDFSGVGGSSGNGESGSSGSGSSGTADGRSGRAGAGSFGDSGSGSGLDRNGGQGIGDRPGLNRGQGSGRNGNSSGVNGSGLNEGNGRNGSDQSNNSSRNGNNRGRSSSNDENRSGADSEERVRVGGMIWEESENSALTGVSGQLEVGIDNRSLAVNVSNGSFAFEAPASAMIRFYSAVLDDRPARVIAPSTPVLAQSSGAIRVFVRYDALATLNVLSAETGQALTGIEVVRLQDFHRSTLEHPGWALPADYRLEESQSPVSLDGRLGMIGSAVVLHVRAAGHEWKRLTVDLVAGGERDVLLFPAADLNLVLDGATYRNDIKLRIRPPESFGMPYMEMPIEGISSQMIQGLLSGTWNASLESGHWNLNPTVYAETLFEVQLNEQNVLSMTVPDDDEDRSELAGTVFVPNGWYLDNFSVRIRPTGAGSDPVNDTLTLPSAEMGVEEIGGGLLYSWGPVMVKYGSYGILVLPVGVGDLFEVGEEGVLNADIELPSPVDVQVTTLIEGTAGELATPGLIRWAPVRPQGVPGAGAVPIPSIDDGLFEFQAPVGDVIISVSDQAYVPRHKQVTVTFDGENQFEIELKPAMGMSLLLDNNGTSIPWDISWHPLVEPREKILTRGRTGSGYRILVKEEGEYIVELPEMDGFYPVDPVPVMCVPGEVLEVVIPLEAE